MDLCPELNNEGPSVDDSMAERVLEEILWTPTLEPGMIDS